jgi:hypothetical protein
MDSLHQGNGLEAMKLCPRCKEEKLLGCFSKNKQSKDGFQFYCKQCESVFHKTKRKENRDRKVIVPPTTKACPGCGLTKPASDFSKSRRDKDGLQSKCKRCSSASYRVRHRKNTSRDAIVLPDFKVCPRCKLNKAGADFHKAKCTKDGVDSYCKECSAIRRLFVKYKVTEDWIIQTLESQGLGCAICKWIPGAKDKALAVDHNHVTGTARGLLCQTCNTSLGLFKDSVERLDSAIRYLNSDPLETLYKKYLSKVVKTNLLADQNCLCKICTTRLTTVTGHLDHCHSSAKIRGYLCRDCNIGLGGFKDSSTNLTRAIRYIEVTAR